MISPIKFSGIEYNVSASDTHKVDGAHSQALQRPTSERESKAIVSAWAYAIGDKTHTQRSYYLAMNVGDIDGLLLLD